MKLTLIALNLLAAALIIPAMMLVDTAQLANAQSMYTELDRAQIIDREMLARRYPNETANDRYLIPKKYVGSRRNAWMVGYPCMFGFILNALLIGCFMERRKKPNQTIEPTGNTRAGDFD